MLPPITNKLTQEEKEACLAFADWLKSSAHARHPNTTELDAWNLYRWVLELEGELKGAEKRS